MGTNARSIEDAARDEERSDWRRDDVRLSADAHWSDYDGATSRLVAALVPFTTEELELARNPHPHAFARGDIGFAPVGEVTVVAAAGREGKTAVMQAIAVAFALGTGLGGMSSPADRSVIVYSSEDDRAQFARRAAAHMSLLDIAAQRRLRDRLLVPDLSRDGMGSLGTVLRGVNRELVESIAVPAIIAAVREMTKRSIRPGLIIFETVSTLSDADEDNRAFRALVLTLRRIARALEVAVVVVHHTSQQAATALPELNIRVGDIRGGTALAFNARQCFMVVNLGSTADPFPQHDLRFHLRELAAPGYEGRVSALVCLDSSKCVDPPPLFFGWEPTSYGPALCCLPPQPGADGVPWRAVIGRCRASRTDQRRGTKDAANEQALREVLTRVRTLSAEGRHPTVRAVSAAAGHSPTWAKPYLEQAVRIGLLSRRPERVPRVREQVDVYRPAHGERTEALAGSGAWSEFRPDATVNTPPSGGESSYVDADRSGD